MKTLRTAARLVIVGVMLFGASPALAQQDVPMPHEMRVLVQKGLTFLGFDAGPADGMFGPRTRAAIWNWQEAKGLETSGYVSQEEAAALAAVGAEAEENPESAAAAQREAQDSAREDQIANGCWKTKENCLKVRTRFRNKRVGRYRQPYIFGSSTVNNRCGGPVFVKICYEMENDDPQCTTFRLDDGETKEIEESSRTERSIKEWEENAKREGFSPPWGDSTPGFLTRNVDWAWIGVPEDHCYDCWSTHCETEAFDNVGIDFKR